MKKLGILVSIVSILVIYTLYNLNVYSKYYTYNTTNTNKDKLEIINLFNVFYETEESLKKHGFKVEYGNPSTVRISKEVNNKELQINYRMDSNTLEYIAESKRYIFENMELLDVYHGEYDRHNYSLEYNESDIIKEIKSFLSPVMIDNIPSKPFINLQFLFDYLNKNKFMIGE